MPTTNNNWPTPVATDLVKDGWEAIKDLGDAIDTTLGVYAPSTPGLTLINTTSFSGVSSQSVNNVFTSTYKDYFIKTTFVGDAANVSASLRLRASGADNSSAVYDFQESAAAATVVSAAASNAQTSFSISAGGRRNQNSTITFFRPQTNTPTNYLATTINYNADFANPLLSHFGGLHRNNYQADGFTIIFSVVSSGSLEVYGYNN